MRLDGERGWHCINCPPDEAVEDHLFCLSDEELEVLDRTCGTNEVERRRYWQEEMRKARAFEDKVRPLFYQFWGEAGYPKERAGEFWKMAEEEAKRRQNG